MNPEGPPTLAQLIAQCAGPSRAECLNALIERLQPVVAGVVSRTLRRHGRCDQELVRDLSQETFLKLMGDRFSLQRRAAGRSEGEIIGLVKTTTANLVLDALRAMRPAAQLEEVIVSDANNEKIEVAVLIQEVDATLKKLLTPASAARDYRIFWFYHRDRMTAKEIALLPGISLSTKGVESVVFRLTADVKAAIGGRKGIPAREAL